MEKKTSVFKDLQGKVPTCFWSSLESHKQQSDNHGEIIHSGKKRIKILPLRTKPESGGKKAEKWLRFLPSASDYSDLKVILQPECSLIGRKKFLPGEKAVGAVRGRTRRRWWRAGTAVETGDPAALVSAQRQKRV